MSLTGWLIKITLIFNHLSFFIFCGGLDERRRRVERNERRAEGD